MKIREIVAVLEELAPFSLQEDYDNAGLIVGDPEGEVSGCLICLDVGEAVIEEALVRKCNLIISHHPLIFKGIRKLTGQTSVERITVAAIRNQIAICAIHTNLDNVKGGVNAELGRRLGLSGMSVLRKGKGLLRKLVTFCPFAEAERVRLAIFHAGAGQIGEYDRCSFNSEGLGSFRAGEKANPFAGSIGEYHFEKEVRIETIFPVHRQQQVLRALIAAHPYEEVAYDIYPLENDYDLAGAGMIGEFPSSMPETAFLELLKDQLAVPVVRHSLLTGKPIRKVAICGGSGSFLIPDAIRSGADAFVTADLKYHQFQEPGDQMLLVDAGHYETEQFTCNLLEEYLKKKFANFAVRISETPVNPVNYF